jgi:uncharacterized protein YrrD
MADAGYPSSYEALEQGTPVLSSDGEQVGTVEHVLAVEAEDVFDGIVVARAGRGHCFADADDVASIHEHAVTLKLNASECEQLPEPSENPAVLKDDPLFAPKHAKLRRAWDLLSGNY